MLAINFLEQPNLLLKIIDYGLLISVNPTSQAEKNVAERIHGKWLRNIDCP